MTHHKNIFLSILLSFIFLFSPLNNQTAAALSSDLFSFVVLSQYSAELDIGDQLYLLAVTSTGKPGTWKSSDSKVASVNTYGVVTAKRAGIAIITAKIKDAEASCEIIVNKTKITLNKTSAALEHGETLKLSATTSNDSQAKWKSSKKSIAIVDEYGKVTGIKPGEATITAMADGSTATCAITVKLPTVKLNKTSLTLYRGQIAKLSATVSSSATPLWRSNKKSVAIVDANGQVTAIKHGSAVITATVDGVTQTCEITVQSPEIKLSTTQISIKKGENITLTADVSSKNLPTWSSSNSSIVTVNSTGKLTALETGKAYIYATEDGTKARCTVIVTK